MLNSMEVVAIACPRRERLGRPRGFHCFDPMSPGGPRDIHHLMNWRHWHWEGGVRSTSPPVSCSGLSIWGQKLKKQNM